MLAHSLGALTVQLEVTEALLDDGADVDLLRTQIGRARRLAVDGLTEARRAVTALREDTPPLPVLLDGLVRQYRADNAAPARLQVTGVPRALPTDAALAAFRTAQEAISNTRKHAPHAAVTVDLAYQDDAATLTVTDIPPGTGAPTPPTLPEEHQLAGTGGGYGLTGLRERAELLGGTLQAGPDGTAWTVRLRLPVPP